jgi:hypothetical protein
VTTIVRGIVLSRLLLLLAEILDAFGRVGNLLVGIHAIRFGTSLRFFIDLRLLDRSLRFLVAKILRLFANLRLLVGRLPTSIAVALRATRVASRSSLLLAGTTGVL